MQAIAESFQYDTLNRVTASTVAPTAGGSSTTVSVAYDALGNITSKSDIGAYTYGPGNICANNFAGPHAVTAVNGAKIASYCYDNNGNLTQGDGRTVAWTAFNMPSLIQQNARQVALTYGPDRARFKRVDLNETGTSTTYYVAGGSHEVVESGTTVTHKTYIGGAAVVIETTSTPQSSQTIYLLHDHLGSTDVITDASGNVQTRYSFDAWGARRNVTWAAFLPMGIPPTLWQTALTTRGFTGHEELDEVGLVHMNGRVYDPQLGRFLSADPVVQDATDLQAYNHYAYVRNNPLSLLDPSGFSWLGSLFKAIGNFFTSIFKAVENALKALLKNSIIRSLIQIAACAFGGPIGCVAAAGGLTLAAGGSPIQALEAMAFAGISIAVWRNVGNILEGAASITKVLVHGVVNGALRMAQGGSFLNGFAIGAAGEFGDVAMRDAGLYSVGGDEGKFLRTSIAGGLGGTASVLTGGKFADGAVSAAFAHLFNDEHGWSTSVENTTRRLATTDFYAAADGTIEEIGMGTHENSHYGYGGYIQERLVDGTIMIYAHVDLDTVSVNVGDSVEAGGYLGNYADPTNGLSTGPHLHLEWRNPGDQTDPASNNLGNAYLGRVLDPTMFESIVMPGGIETRSIQYYDELKFTHPGLDLKRR